MVETYKPTKKHLKLMKAHKNNIQISDMNLSNKFENFEDGILKESETLLYEAKKQPNCFKRYARGRIVKVKFGINIGSEFSGDHFAIVISKGDTMKNPILHVIPITSKKHLKNMDIGEIIYNKKFLFELSKKLEMEENPKEIRKIKQCINYYSKRKDKKSYACIDHIKTISKLSILKEINEYDYISKLKCSNDLMMKIDDAIVKEYTI